MREVVVNEEADLRDELRGPFAATAEIIAVDTPALGDRSYLAHDGTGAVVIDPQRDIDRILDAAAAAGVLITKVFETHLHNDYVTGGLAPRPSRRWQFPFVRPSPARLGEPTGELAA
jgi:glyoxylase-like metal-dependent hydrolase (beta-lactamase superfamily II)